MEYKDNVVIVVGAGSTYSDGLHSWRRGDLHRPFLPPLNRGFFRGCKKGDVSELLESVCQAMGKLYGLDPMDESNDNLEDVLVKIYCDVLSAEPSGRKPREELFRNLIRLLNARMTDTTNSLAPVKTSGIGRIVSRYLDELSFAPQDICLVTFNYDLHIEKNLRRLAGLKKYDKHGGKIFNFPYLYELGDDIQTTAPKGEIPEFAEAADPRKNRISLLKLHGSLNWYSRHASPNPSITALFNPKRDVFVTPQTDVSTDNMQFVGKRRSATYPVVIPPIVGKATVFHQRIKAIWAFAQTRLRGATEAVIFGYSFPPGDYESVNMLENTIGKGEHCRHVSVINPDPSVATRMGMIPKNKPVTLFHSTEEFLAFPLRRRPR